jgi:tetratricopeptide (TPR) repeat protein
MKKHVTKEQQNPIEAFLLLLNKVGDQGLDKMGLPADAISKIKHSLEEASKKNSKEIEEKIFTKEEATSFSLTREKSLEALAFLDKHHIHLFDKESAEKMTALPDKIKEITHAQEPPDLTLQDMFGISDAKLSEAYELSVKLYNAQFFEDALNILILLTQINPYFANIWCTAGMCMQQLHKFDAAQGAYSMAIIIDGSAPNAYMHSIECYLEFKDAKNAKSMVALVESKKNGMKFSPELEHKFAQLKTKISQYR